MKLLLVDLDAGIRAHQDALQVVRRVLEQSHEVAVLGCESALPRCTLINSSGIRKSDAEVARDRAEICAGCLHQQRRLVDGNARRIAIDATKDACTPPQREILRVLRDSVEPLDSRAVIDVTWNGAPLGKMAFFDFALLYKVGPETHLDRDAFGSLVSHLESVFITWNAVDRVASKESFDVATYVSGNPMLNSVIRERLKRDGTRCWSLQFTFSMSDLWSRIWVEEDKYQARKDWNAIQDYYGNDYFPSRRDFAIALDSIRNRVIGRDYNSYSSPLRTPFWDTFEAFHRRYPVLAAIFMSSADELVTSAVAHDWSPAPALFASQEEWVRFILDNANPSVGYVLRLHPRLAPNKREGVPAASQHALMALIEEAKGRDNFLVVEARETFSSYYLTLKSASTFVAWSTLSFESVALGVPSVVAFPNHSIYPMEDFCEQPVSEDDFRRVLRDPGGLQISPGQKRALVRWLSLYFSASAVAIPAVRCADTRWRKLLRKFSGFCLDCAWLGRFLAAHYRGRIFLSRNRELLLKPFRAASDEAELAACVERFENFHSVAKAYFEKT